MRNWLGAGTMILTAAVAAADARSAAADRDPAGPQSVSIASARSALDQLRATDLRGTLWTPERLRGRVVLIDFWATWCAPCLAELPRLKELRDQYDRGEFEILGVMLDATSRRTVVSWLNRNRIDWPQVHERGGYDGALPAAFGVQQLPATVLMDRTGEVAAVGLRRDALEKRIEELVNRRTRS